MEKIHDLVLLSLHHGNLFLSNGLMRPKSFLIHGPSGTGKTLLARAIANETGAFTFAMKENEVMSKYAGESEANLRKAFEKAAEVRKLIRFFLK